MADLPESRKMPHRIHDVVRSLALRLVDDQGAVKRGGLWLARHIMLLCDQILAIRVLVELVLTQCSCMAMAAAKEIGR